jgi:hypothetical protein
LEGNSIWKEIGRKYCYKEGNEKEILFYLIMQFSHNFVQKML